MRIELTLHRTNRQQRMLPMDYNYYIHSWIYKVISNADAEFSNFLHNRGYGDEHKPYKLFCFGKLNFGKAKMWKEERLFMINQDQLSLQIAFNMPEAAANFIKGLFIEQQFFIGNREAGLDLKVAQVTVLDNPDFKETMHYTLRTPWVVSVKEEGKSHPQFKFITDPDTFIPLAIKHIVEKSNRILKMQLTSDDLHLEVDRVFKERDGIVVKPNTSNPIRVQGSRFSFKLTAPREVHSLIWNAGISEKSAMGFGWVEDVGI